MNILQFNVRLAEGGAAIERETRTKYGFGKMSDVRVSGRLEDSTESFLFAETFKYFYLLFKDEQILDLMHQVLNTEAHPFSVYPLC